MWCELTIDELSQLVNRQLKNFWNIELSKETDRCFENTLKRLEKCFSYVKNKYFWHENGVVAFRIEHSVQYSIFLYMLSNELFKSELYKEANYVYFLNKVMNSVEWFYEVELPEIFCAEHPLSSVLGKAKYGNYLMVYQGVTVGGNWKDGKLYYPVLGEHVTLYANSTILGNAKIGNNVIISSGTYIKDEVIPDNAIVFGTSPNLIIKKRNSDEIKKFFEQLWND